MGSSTSTATSPPEVPPRPVLPPRPPRLEYTHMVRVPTPVPTNIQPERVNQSLPVITPRSMPTPAVVPTIERQVQQVQSWQKNMRSLKPRIGYLLNNKTMADFRFFIGNERKIYYAHKLIYATTSNDFFNEFYIKGNDKIYLHNTRPDAFEQFNTYVYTDKVKLEDTNVLDIFQLAVKYEMEHLVQLCLSAITLLLRDEKLINFPCEVLRIEKLCSFHVRTDFIKAVERNLKIFSESIDLHLLSEENFNVILKSDDLNVESEMEVIQFAMSWAASVCTNKLKIPATSINKRNVLKTSFNEIRFPTITLDELQTLITENNGSLTSEEIMKLTLYICDQRGDINFPTVRRTKIIGKPEGKPIKVVDVPESLNVNHLKPRTLCEQFFLANLKLFNFESTNLAYWTMNFCVDKQIKIHGVELTFKSSFFKTPDFVPSIFVQIISASGESVGRIDKVLASEEKVNKNYVKMKFFFKGFVKINPIFGYKLEVGFNCESGGYFFPTVNNEIRSGEYCLRMNENKTCVSQILFKK